MNRKTGIGLMIVALGAGFLGGVESERLLAARRRGGVVDAQTGQGPRYRVPVGAAAVRGDKAAKVTIIEYSDYQCPFCSRVEETLARIQKEYSGKVRLVWKDAPLPFHDKAKPAAEAARAAGEQGKFWEMHDKLFANQQALDRAALERYAQELGLNLPKFRAALDSHNFEKAIEGDLAEAQNFGARGTPSFFINGRPLRGAQPFEQFKKMIDEELATASGSYEEIVKTGLAKAEEPKPQAPAGPQPGEPDPSTIYKAEIGTSPVRGPKDAKVTIVLWSDFQCPFCSRVEGVLDEVRKAYGDKVRIVWKNLPLPFHPNAMPAAEAAIAAGDQGKFWEMHDLLFKNQQALDRAHVDGYAKQLGLDAKKFAAALDAHRFEKEIEADAQAGAKIGARGTPTMFINGKVFVGAQPLDAFKAKIDEALKTAKPYDELMKDAKAEVPAAPAGGSPGGGPPPIDKTVYKVDPSDGYARGPKTAPVTIVEFSDFQCPFCSRVEPTLAQVTKTYGNKVRIVWKNYPLPFHDMAPLAAEAALAAGEQGKFWEMHDKLFANQQALDRTSLEKYAQELGLDLTKFRSALDGGTFKAAIAKDKAQADALAKDGMGTPTFFVNGRKIAGAYPFESFRQVIDEELAKKHMAVR
jgi:protein-disulfide isomerase